MIVGLDPTSPIPPYEQLRAQIERSIIAGQLPAGHRLPSIRQLARDLGLSPGTVARTYRELEAANLVLTHGRNGTVVSQTTGAPDRTTLTKNIVEGAARDLRQLGVTLAQAQTLLQDAYQQAHPANDAA